MTTRTRALTGLIVCLAVLHGASLLAQTNPPIQYFYDDLGRLVKVVDPAGNVATYTYDAVGNLLSITRSAVASNTLAIFNFNPQQGPIGTTVTIQGQGFSSTPAANTVRFNGIPATVLSASATTLVAAVPVGATTGPISVTVGGTTVTSLGTFTVLQVPAILSISPKAALANTTVPNFQVSGANLTGSTFSFLSAGNAITISSVSINPSGTLATMNLTINAGVSGNFVLVATSPSGSSSPFQSTSNTLTVSNPNLAPTALSFLGIPGFANDVAVNGDFAYVAAGSAGLQVVDVANRSVPRIVASLSLPGNANGVKLLGSRAYVAAGLAGLKIIDITNPFAPVVIGSAATPGARDVALSGNLAFVATGVTGLRVVDVTNASAPVVIGSLTSAGTAKGVDVSGNLAVVAAGSAGLQVVDLSNPLKPQLVGTVATPGDARRVVAKGSTAYVAAFDGSLEIVDFTTPAAPVIVGSTPASSGGTLQAVALGAAIGRTFVFGADVSLGNKIPIIDVTTPNSPTIPAKVDFSTIRNDQGKGIAADSSFVYLTASQGVFENGVSGDTRLYIGQYLQRQDALGVAPTLSITSPAQGITVLEGQTLPITVTATDDVAVAAVNFTVNGQIVFTATTTPYRFGFTVPVGVTGVTFGATAVDFGGNVGVASNVVVNVRPDPLTTASGKVTDRSGNALSGATVTCLGLSGTTALDGTFSIANVPSVLGAIRCTGTFTAAGGSRLTGPSVSVFPVPGAVTSVGTFQIGPIAIFEDFGPTFNPANWFIDGSAFRDAASSSLFLTTAAFLQGGRGYLRMPFSASQFHAEFDYNIFGGSGSDGLTFAWVRDLNYAISLGGGLAFGGAKGFAVEFDSFPNPGEVQARHIALLQDETLNELVTFVIEVRGSHHVVIDFVSGHLQVFFDGVLVIDFTIPNYTPFDAFMGFTAATGGLDDNHVIKNFRLTASPAVAAVP